MRAAELEDRLVWILGGPRTGSSWLLDLMTYPLTADSDAASGASMRDGTTGLRPHAIPINEPYLGVHLAPIVAIHQLGIFTPAEVREGDASYFFDERYTGAWLPHLRRMALDRFAAQAELAAKEHGLSSPLVVIKEPNGSHAAPILMSTFPRSRLLFLLRDGRDVLDSLLDAVSPGGWLAGGPDSASVAAAEGRIEFLRKNSWLWIHRMTMIQRALAKHPSELSITVRYERLRADPAGVLREIGTWLGLELGEGALREAAAATSFDAYPPEVKGRGKPLRFASPGHWRDGLSDAEQETVAEVMGAKLAELGYDA
jgi:Sulfotransferase family